MNYSVVWCDEFIRIEPMDGLVLDDKEQSPKNLPVTLRSVGNQFVSFQLVIGPIAQNQAVKFIPADLKNQKKTLLSRKLFDVYIEWYQQYNGKWYPEVLLPQELVGGSNPALRKKNGLSRAKYVGFWIDIFIPSGTVSGEYVGEASVIIDRDKLDVPIRLDIVNASILDSCCLHVSLNNYADTISMGWKELAGRTNALLSQKYLRVERNVFRTAHEHKMFLHYLPYGHSGYVFPGFAPPLEGNGRHKRIADWTEWDKHFGPYFDGSAFKGTKRGEIPVTRFYLPLNLCWPADFVKFGQPGYEAEWRAVGGELREHFRKKGWFYTRFDMFLNHKQRFLYFPWDTEEARFLEDNDIHRYFRKLWTGTFDRKTTHPVKFDYTLGTTWTYGIDIQSDFVEFIDVFIAGTNMMSWFHQYIPSLHKKGRQIWACTHSGTIVNAPRASAFVPLLMWMIDADGYMPCWCTMGGWGASGIYHLPDKGSATFLYCGSEFNSEESFASLRMKVQRNMLQVCDQLQQIAEQKGKSNIKEKVNKLLGIKQTDWYSKRPDFVTQKLPMEWENADWATQEPPAAGWQRFHDDKFRAIRKMALTLMEKVK